MLYMLYKIIISALLIWMWFLTGRLWTLTPEPRWVIIPVNIVLTLVVVGLTTIITMDFYKSYTKG